MIGAVLVYIVSFIFVYFGHAFKIYRRRRRNLDMFPGPRPRLIYGNSLEISTADKVLPVFLNWTEKYGGVFKFFDGLQHGFVVSNFKVLERILTNSNYNTKSRYYRFLLPWLKEGLLTSSGEKWKNRRKIITPTFHFKILEEFLEIFHSCSNVLIQKLKLEVDKPSIDIYPLVTLCTLDVIYETAMGVKLNAQSDSNSEYIKCVRFLLNNVMERSYSAIYQFDFLYSFTKKYRTEQYCLKIVHDFTESVIRNRRAELIKEIQHQSNKKLKVAFLDLLLQTNIEGKPLTDMDIREEVDTFMFEGHDTTASAISFALYCLSEHPDVQKKAVEEIKIIFKGNKDKILTIDELQDLKYLEMVIKETLRLYPAVPLTSRELLEDFDYGNYCFLKGSPIMLFYYGAHMDPKNFPNPEKFDPERFSAELDNERNLFCYLPFSAGPRNCIGKKFGMLELKSLISKILINFELLPPNPKHEMILADECVLKSLNGIKISLRTRMM